jgi:AcrR family transcriptional regulator
MPGWHRDHAYVRRPVMLHWVPMSIVRSRQAERKEETRRELIDTAARVFAEEGFQAASLERIAREAGFTTGAIYWHFRGGKDELFLAVFEEYASSRVGEVTAAHDSGGPGLVPRARAMADQWMERLEEDPGIVVATFEFFLHALRVPALREALATRLAAVRLAVGRMLEADARAEGVRLPLPAPDVATAMRELGIGLALARLADPDAVPRELYGNFVEAFYTLAAAS